MSSNSVLTMLLSQQPPAMPVPAEAMVVTIELPPGDPGTPPHRHSGPVFGYMLEGEMIFELEGQPMLTLVSDRELAERRDRRAPRPGS